MHVVPRGRVSWAGFGPVSVVLVLPADPGNPSFFIGGVDDFSPRLGRPVGDQFWHPQGVQLKAPNSRIIVVGQVCFGYSLFTAVHWQL